MAGRILPVALAAIIGVSIGVATFDGEFKKQRLARMEEEYQRYARFLSAHLFTLAHTLIRELAAAAAASNSVSPAPLPARQLPVKQEQTATSASPANSWSNMLGLWAWKKDAARETVPLKKSNEEAKGKP